MTITGMGKPPSGDYEVFKVEEEGKTTLAYITVYANNKTTFEFDSDKIYSQEEIAEILQLAKEARQ